MPSRSYATSASNVSGNDHQHTQQRPFSTQSPILTRYNDPPRALLPARRHSSVTSESQLGEPLPVHPLQTHPHYQPQPQHPHQHRHHRQFSSMNSNSNAPPVQGQIYTTGNSDYDGSVQSFRSNDSSLHHHHHSQQEQQQQRNQLQQQQQHLQRRSSAPPSSSTAAASHHHLTQSSYLYRTSTPSSTSSYSSSSPSSSQRLRSFAPVSAPVSASGPVGHPPSSNFASQPSRRQQQLQAAAHLQHPQQQHRAHPQQPHRTAQSTFSNNNGSSVNYHQQQQQQSYQTNFSNNMSPSLHPQFRAKAVCRLTCKSCLSDVCMRGMKAILLADSRVELYSTDRAPRGVQLVYDDYRTRSCKCRICDVACLGCGNTLGYHVTQPCEPCLEACNNGHFWMFHSDGVSCTERYLPKASSTRASLSRSRTSASTPSSSSSSSYSSTSLSLLSGPLSTSSCALVPLPDATSQSQNRHRRRRRRTRHTELGSRVISTTATTTTSTTTQPTGHDISFRRRTSIHDIEYNRAVNSNSGGSGGHGTNGSEYYDDNDKDFHPDSAENDSEDGDVEDSDEGESEFDGCDDNSDESDDDKEEEEGEEGEEGEEEKPIVMLWAALHAQEERYLQQMQQQLLIQQQQQLIQQQRIQEQLRRREALEQGLELGPAQGQQQDESSSNSPGLQSQTQSLSVISPPAAGSRYHNMISTAISNASMMLWDEGRAQNQYDSFVAR